MNQTKDERIAELEKALAELLNASSTPMTKARYPYLESVRAKCEVLLGKPEGKSAYFIMETERFPDRGYRALIAKEGELGFYKTDWNWGEDKKEAQDICDEMNHGLGIDRKEAMIIQLCSMRQS